MNTLPFRSIARSLLRVSVAAVGLSSLPAPAVRAQTTAALSYTAAPNHYVTVSGQRLAWRSVGVHTASPPLVLFQHFTGTMDDWDSSLIDTLAQRRQVIVLGNPGVGASTGPAPDSIAAMATLAEQFIDTLKLGQVDILGFSIGGSVAQQLVADRPELARKIILVGAGPQGGEGIANLQTVIANGFRRGAELHLDPKIPLFFTGSANGLAQGSAFMHRIGNHTVDPEPAATPASIGAQAKALITWGLSPSNAAALAAIKQPVLIVNGSDDLIVPTVNSWFLYRHIPNAQLILYPDSGHGSLFQYHDLFASEVNRFLDDRD